MSIVANRPPERHLGETCACDKSVHAALAAERSDRSGECWTWTLKPNKMGYGVIFHAGRPWLAHRFVYETLVARIPDGLSIDHLCRNRICVNPDHLEPVTYEENWRRGNGAGRANGADLSAPSPLPTIERRSYLSRKGKIDPSDPRHGTTTGYSSLKCRCEPCRAANTAYKREWRRRAGGVA